MKHNEYDPEPYRFDEMQLMLVKQARQLWFIGFALGVLVGLAVASLWRLV